MTMLSILDLVRITEGSDARTALDNARDVARHAEGGATGASGSPSTTTCRALPARPRRW